MRESSHTSIKARPRIMTEAPGKNMLDFEQRACLFGLETTCHFDKGIFYLLSSENITNKIKFNIEV